MVVITLGTGFGSAFLEQGIPVVSRTDVPKEGCLWHLPFQDSIADDYFSTGWFVRAYERQTGKKIEGVKSLMGKAESDALAKSLFSQFGQNLAECLAPWLKSFSAELLIIGGNIAHALPFFENSLHIALQKTGTSIKVAASSLGENAALLGSARLLDDVFWKMVSESLPTI